MLNFWASSWTSYRNPSVQQPPLIRCGHWWFRRGTNWFSLPSKCGWRACRVHIWSQSSKWRPDILDTIGSGQTSGPLIIIDLGQILRGRQQFVILWDHIRPRLHCTIKNTSPVLLWPRRVQKRQNREPALEKGYLRSKREKDKISPAEIKVNTISISRWRFFPVYIHSKWTRFLRQGACGTDTWSADAAWDARDDQLVSLLSLQFWHSWNGLGCAQVDQIG